MKQFSRLNHIFFQASSSELKTFLNKKIDQDNKFSDGDNIFQ